MEIPKSKTIIFYNFVFQTTPTKIYMASVYITPSWIWSAVGNDSSFKNVEFAKNLRCHYKFNFHKNTGTTLYTSTTSLDSLIFKSQANIAIHLTLYFMCVTRSHYIFQAGLELTTEPNLTSNCNPTASASQVLELQTSSPVFI